MLYSLALIFIFALIFASICQRLKLPRIVGMLFTGILLGPFVFNALNDTILFISADLRQLALIIILLKAGLSLNFSDLEKVGRPAFLMSFIPALFEIAAFYFFAPLLFNISSIDALLMGSVIAAVSPAVIVPRMIELIEKKYGTKKSIPQLILASSTCDDIFVILLFSTFLSMSLAGNMDFLNLINIPTSITTGVIIGCSCGYLLAEFFEYCFSKKHFIRNSVKIIIMLSIAFLLVYFEKALENYLSYSALLAIICMACMLKYKSIGIVSKRLSDKFGKLWIAAELILFVLVGAAVDINYALSAGVMVIIMLSISLLFRVGGVFISLSLTNLSYKERLFCAFAYLPKATVQAAIGAIPLSLGLESGNLILSAAVFSILLTAPLGAFLIDKFYHILLTEDNK